MYSVDHQWCLELIHTLNKKVWIDSNLRVWIDSIKGCGSTQDVIEGPNCTCWTPSVQTKHYCSNQTKVFGLILVWFIQQCFAFTLWFQLSKNSNVDKLNQKIKAICYISNVPLLFQIFYLLVAKIEIFLKYFLDKFVKSSHCEFEGKKFYFLITS